MILDAAQVHEFRRAVGGGARVLVSTHIHPDPDAIGSALAAAEIIRMAGGEPTILLEDKVPVRCSVLPGSEQIQQVAAVAEMRSFGVAVIVDAGGLSRIGDVETKLAPDCVIFNFDHHLSNDNFGRLNFVSIDYSATAELLFDVARELGFPVSPSLAANLFAGILTDTGRFRYSNTTPQTLRIAAELAASGANVTAITNALYFDIAAEDIRHIGEIFSTLEFFADGCISTMFVRLDQLVEDPDTVVDYGLSIRGVRAAALLSETVEGKIRASLRARDGINVAKIAEGFGGGGHEKAAGFRMRGTLESVRERLLPELIAALKSNEVTTRLAL